MWPLRRVRYRRNGRCRGGRPPFPPVARLDLVSEVVIGDDAGHENPCRSIPAAGSDEVDLQVLADGLEAEALVDGVGSRVEKVGEQYAVLGAGVQAVGDHG